MRRGGTAVRAAAPAAVPAPGTVLITGANRGLGFEFNFDGSVLPW